MPRTVVRFFSHRIGAGDGFMRLMRGHGLSAELPGRVRPTPVTLPAHGLHNLSNALAAAAVGICVT